MRLLPNLSRPILPSSRTNRESLPLGIDVGPVEVVVAHVVAEGDALRVKRVGRRPHNGRPESATVLLLDELGIEERRCVLSAPPNEMTIAPWVIPTAFPARYLDAAAAFQVEDGEVVDGGGRVVRHDRLDKATLARAEEETRFVVTARSAHVRDLEAFAAQANVRLIAVDSPALAWLRIAQDGVVDDRPRTPFVTLLANDGPMINVLPNSDEAFPSALKTIVSTATAARPLLLNRLLWAGDASTTRFSAAFTRLKEIGVVLEPLAIEGHVTPYWAFAFALASWSWN